MGSGVKILIYRDDLVKLKGIGIFVFVENSVFIGSGVLVKSILQYVGLFYVKYYNQVCCDLKDRCLVKNILRILDVGKLDYRFVIYVIVNWFVEDVDCKEDELFDFKMIMFKVFKYGDFLCIFEKKLKNFEKIVMLLLGVGMYIYCIFLYFSVYLFLIYI